MKALTLPLLFAILFLFLLPSCAPSYDFVKVENVSALELDFADDRWDGVTIPPYETCIPCGGTGATPELIINNIPEEANALILYFQRGNALEINPNFIQGRNGVLGYHIPLGSDEVKVPSVAGHTWSLPDNFFSVKRPAYQPKGESGVYLPPCSCAGLNRETWYMVHVKAVYLAPSEDEESYEYASGTLNLGSVR